MSVAASAGANGGGECNLTGVLKDARPDIIINASGQTSDSHPSAATLSDGTTWVVWKAYQASQEWVLGRRLGLDSKGPVDDGPVVEISEQPGIHDAPHIVAMGSPLAGPKSAYVAWSSLQDGRWRILGRRLDGERWQPESVLSDLDTDAFKPVAIDLGDGRLLVAWSACRDKRFRIQTRLLDHGTWADPVSVSSDRFDAFRPVLAVDSNEGQVWVFWDSYQDGNYVVMGRSIWPEPKPAERISQEAANCLTPTALGSKQQGLCVAWVMQTDVIGGEGAIDQLHTIHMAVRGKQGWRMVTDAQGNTEAATLTQGLLARMEPEPGGVWGYLGRRRHPMLLQDNGAVVLLWERKSVYAGPTPLHHGPTPEVTGELIARRYAGNHWETPVMLYQGMVDYHLVAEPRTYDHKFQILYSQLPRYHRRIYHRTIVDLRNCAPFEQDEWTGWKPVQLPLEQDVPRHEITIDGQSYKLYWADSHCHSNLSADAEGEPDELLHYARDRANLDFVVVQENDEIYNIYLTESEYAMGRFLANWIRQDGTFIALPGFEWTQRVRTDEQTDPTQYMGGCYLPNTDPNHRTVIYPPSGGPLVRWTEVGNDINKLYEAVESAGGILHTQHWTWVPNKHPCETSIEVTAGWDIYIKNSPDHIHAALSAGHKLGFVGTSDTHRRVPGLGGGLAGIYAESLTPKAILDAYRKHRVYATNGSHIILEPRANGRLMGEEIETNGPVTLSLFAQGTKPIVRVTLVRDGKEIKTFDGTGDAVLEITFEDDSLKPGNHWYYWRVEQEGTSPLYPSNVKVARGHYAWSTPHWVNKKG